MAQISVRLKNIEEGVQNISLFLDEQRLAKIHSSIKQLSDISKVMSHPNIEATERDIWYRQLLSLEADMSEVFEHFQIESKRRLDSICNVHDCDKCGTGNTHKHLLEALNKFNNFYSGWKSTQMLLFASRAMMLRNATPATIDVIGEKIERCNLNKAEKLMHESLATFETKAKQLLSSAVWNTKDTLRDRRNEVLRELERSRVAVNNDIITFNEGFEKAKQHQKIFQQALKGGIELLAKTDNNGNIIAMQIEKKLGNK